MDTQFNKIKTILMKEIDRLDQKKIDKIEISRSNAISNNAMSYIKTINLEIRIQELKEQNKNIADLIEMKDND